jgi:ATP-dependent Clp protease ATP-binding subunit ClpA
VTLTDAFVSDRMRPDKAIDALDEACAHMQAVVSYSPRAEELMRRRASLLRREEAAKRASPNDRRTVRQEQLEEDEAPDDRSGPDSGEGRDGFGALERFGAELEALFMGPPPRRPTPNAAEPVSAPVPAPAPASAPSSSALSDIESELSRLLMEQGIVIRGHDIARVVSLMSGKSVVWTE